MKRWSGLHEASCRISVLTFLRSRGCFVGAIKMGLLYLFCIFPDRETWFTRRAGGTSFEAGGAEEPLCIERLQPELLQITVFDLVHRLFSPSHDRRHGHLQGICNLFDRAAGDKSQ
jgi:hypothetical protein